MNSYDEVSRRASSWLSGYSAKELSLMFNVTERTAKGWHSGNLPQNKHLISMIERWGMAFVEDIFAPALDQEITPYNRLERIQRDVRALLKSKPIISIVIVLASVFFQTIGDNPIIRAPRPSAARARTRIERSV